jgi:hypothetical protein
MTRAVRSSRRERKLANVSDVSSYRSPQGGRDINLKLWSKHFDTGSLDGSFFFEPGHASMHDTIASIKTVLRSTPTMESCCEGGYRITNHCFEFDWFGFLVAVAVFIQHIFPGGVLF